jgi:hypothetical protein
MSIEQRYRIATELVQIASDLNHKYITENKNIEKMQNLAKELVEDQPEEGSKTLIED